MRLGPNSSLYHATGRRRYLEVHLTGRHRTHRLTSVRNFRPLNTVLEAARGGATIDQLAQRLVAAGVTAERVERYVDELVTEQLPVPDLSVIVTGEEPAEALIATLRAAWPDVRVDLEQPADSTSTGSGSSDSASSRYRRGATPGDSLRLAAALLVAWGRWLRTAGGMLAGGSPGAGGAREPRGAGRWGCGSVWSCWWRRSGRAGRAPGRRR